MTTHAPTTTPGQQSPKPEEGQKKSEEAQEDLAKKADPKYPYLMYNHKTRQQKAAKDKEDEEKLAKAGFTEDPLPPEDPASLTPVEVEQLKSLLAKAAAALGKLGQLSQEPEAGGKKSGNASASHPQGTH